MHAHPSCPLEPPSSLGTHTSRQTSDHTISFPSPFPAPLSQPRYVLQAPSAPSGDPVQELSPCRLQGLNKRAGNPLSPRGLKQSVQSPALGWGSLCYLSCCITV